jgi:hypothetical protein
MSVSQKQLEIDRSFYGSQTLNRNRSQRCVRVYELTLLVAIISYFTVLKRSLILRIRKWQLQSTEAANWRSHRLQVVNNITFLNLLEFEP